MLNGRKCIQEALERCSVAFAGRTAGYVDQNYANVNMAGNNYFKTSIKYETIFF